MKLAAYLINLDEDADRLAWMAGELGRAGIAFTRVPAVRGDAVPESVARHFPKPGEPTGLRRGEIGCYASHLAIHQMFLADPGLDAALVLEDDLEAGPTLAPLLAALDRLPPGWDLVRLSNPAKAPALKVTEIVSGAELVKYLRVPNNTGAYLISRAGAAKMAVFDGVKRWPIDEDMRRPWDRDLATYGVLPPPVRSNIFDTSSIERMASRGLQKETALAKFRRRRRLTPVQWLRRLRWQAGFLGVGGWLTLLGRLVAAKTVGKVQRRV